MLTVYVCPTCQNWTLEVPRADLLTWKNGYPAYVVRPDEIDQILREHLYQCFGVPDALQLAS